MKGSLMFGLIAGTCIGAVVATMYKPARDVINKGSKIAKQTAKDMMEK